jgi:hypothetical protein
MPPVAKRYLTEEKYWEALQIVDGLQGLALDLAPGFASGLDLESNQIPAENRIILGVNATNAWLQRFFRSEQSFYNLD